MDMYIFKVTVFIKEAKKIRYFIPPPRILAFTRYCNAQYRMVYGVKTGGRKGVEYCAIGLQQDCNRVGDSSGRGNKRRIDSCTKAYK